MMSTGQKVLWLDFDSDRYETVSRLCAMGAPGEMQDELFDYRQPDQSPEGNTLAREALREGVYGLVVIDGVTDAMSLMRMSIKDNDDFSTFARTILRPLTVRGAAVVMVDHVTKSEDGRGRFAIGAQSKMSVLTGASYVVDMVELVAPGRSGGVIRLRVGKDRPGYVRARSATWRGKDRLQEAARIHVDSSGDLTRITVHAPTLDPFEDEGDTPSARNLNAEILEWLRRENATTAESTRSVRQIREGVGARRDEVAEAVRSLQESGLLTVMNLGGSRGQQVHLRGS